MADEKKKKEYQSPEVSGDSSDLDDEFCTPIVCVLVFAVAVGNVLGDFNAAAAWNGGYYQNVLWTDNWAPNPPPPCSK